MDQKGGESSRIAPVFCRREEPRYKSKGSQDGTAERSPQLPPALRGDRIDPNEDRISPPLARDETEEEGKIFFPFSLSPSDRWDPRHKWEIPKKPMAFNKYIQSTLCNSMLIDIASHRHVDLHQFTPM